MIIHDLLDVSFKWSVGLFKFSHYTAVNSIKFLHDLKYDGLVYLEMGVRIFPPLSQHYFIKKTLKSIDDYS